MSVKAEYNLGLKVTETLTSGDLAESVQEVSRIDSRGTLDASSTVPATKSYSDALALIAGAASLDLAALVMPLQPAINLTGLKVQLLKVKNRSTTQALNVAFGASNPYPIFGATETVDIPVGGELLMFFNDELPDVAALVKAIDFASADLTAPFDVQIVAG